ncbi:unnamed protein product [Orchesella dallaii]|uniref:C2H2-type domain-containing protein n=1 Tax=Orchesella dallaii TaxID=48710 RepID=A0ABP1RQX7_9HEXA
MANYLFSGDGVRFYKNREEGGRPIDDQEHQQDQVNTENGAALTRRQRNIWDLLAEDDDFELDQSTFEEILKAQQQKEAQSSLQNSSSSSSHLDHHLNPPEVIDLVSEDDEESQNDNHLRHEVVNFQKNNYMNFNLNLRPDEAPPNTQKVTLVQMENQLILHQEESSPIPCPDCGCFVLPSKLEWHRSHRHPETNPDYSMIKKEVNIRWGYKCKHCPAFFRKRNAIKIHAQLHLPGAQVQICQVENCGWHVNPQNMTMHRRQNHPELRWNCELCNAIYTTAKGLKLHRNLHERGDGVVCDKCGWVVAPHYLAHHDSAWHSPGAEARGAQQQSSSSVVHLNPNPNLSKNELTKELNRNRHPDYFSRFANRSRRFFCRHCPFVKNQRKAMENHLLLHKPGVDSVVCKVCGWFVPARKINSHMTYHSRPNILKRVENI